VLQHHATGAPVHRFPGLPALAEADSEAGRQLLGLGEIGLGAGGQRPARQGRDPLVGRGSLALVDQDREIALAGLRERIGARNQPFGIVAGEGADARGRAILSRGVEIRRDQADRPVAAHLQRQLPPQLDRLADHRGQKRHFGHQRLHLRRVVVLLQDLLQRRVEPRDAAPDVGTVELERQDGVIPCDAGRQGHG
jgi:hypothetical protein